MNSTFKAACFCSLGLNFYLLARLPEINVGGGIHAATSDEQMEVTLYSMRSANPLRNRDVFGELEVESRNDDPSKVFSLRFNPAANSEMAFRRDASVKWVNDSRIVEVITPYMLLRLDLDALKNYQIQTPQ